LLPPGGRGDARKDEMTKQEQFLWIVQSTVLANAINLSSQPESAEKYRRQISAAAVFISMDEATRASGLIPDDLTAGDAILRCLGENADESQFRNWAVSIS
jgi:hypothetical protein